MTKQAKLMIFANILLGLLFILFNFIYDYFGNPAGHHALWSPLWLTFYNYQAPSDIGVQEPNFSFYFFWASIIINVYFIFRLQKETATTNNLPNQKKLENHNSSHKTILPYLIKERKWFWRILGDVSNFSRRAHRLIVFFHFSRPLQGAFMSLKGKRYNQNYILMLKLGRFECLGNQCN